MVTLSVSICAITSSASTASPGPFKTAAMEPSVMESPIAGTATTSAAAKALAGGAELAESDERADGPVARDPTRGPSVERERRHDGAVSVSITIVFGRSTEKGSCDDVRRRYSGRRRRALDVAFARKNGDFRETKPRRPALASRCASENGEGDAPGGVARGEGGGRDVARADKGLRGGAVVGTRALA
jgi:hypothetical protein